MASAFFSAFVSCSEIYDTVATASDDCPLCKPALKPSGRTSSQDVPSKHPVCPRCRHALSDSAAVDQFTRHSECSSTDSAVSSLFCVVLCTEVAHTHKHT